MFTQVLGNASPNSKDVCTYRTLFDLSVMQCYATSLAVQYGCGTALTISVVMDPTYLAKMVVPTEHLNQDLD